MNIVYSMPDEKIVALAFAELLQDTLAKKILAADAVASRAEAIHLSRFYWRLVAHSAQGGASPPCESATEFWIEKLHDSIGDYLKRAGYAAEWNEEENNAGNL